MAFLILNAGSSSLKFSVIDYQDGRVHASGGFDASEFTNDAAVHRIVADLGSREPPAALEAVVHRVVHGGSRFTGPVLVTAEVRQALEDLNDLAPLHNPPGLAAIDAALELLPEVPHVAVFDTAFHATLMPEAFTYPLPFDWTERWGLRRFGFHGFSHEYGAGRAAEMARRENGFRCVVAHLGNGASVAAVRSGVSVDTSMGFTPLEGLMMGTRSGSVDPGLLLYLQAERDVSIIDLEKALNHESGLLGVSGVSSDMRQVAAAADSGHQRAALAMRIFAHRARQAIGAHAVTLGGVDALVFTGGIGENSAGIRRMICEGLSCLGLELDVEANAFSRADTVVSSPASSGLIVVVRAREDLMMARAAARSLRAGSHGGT
jgi:acetate kinase